MSEFLDACRREWRRLGVPDPIAGEMAADLEADLAQAEAEGVAAEEVLGSGAFDPTGFAATWAAERGVVPGSSPDAAKRPGRRWPSWPSTAPPSSPSPTGRRDGWGRPFMASPATSGRPPPACAPSP